MNEIFNYNLTEDPLASFEEWYDEANLKEENAQVMSVSTYDSTKNRPNSRYLLYKGIVNNQIAFYTNYSSPKSKELAQNPEISLAFYWHQSKKQVRIHGKVSKMSVDDSTEYFHSRDRDSQIASYISHQSYPIFDKNTLLQSFRNTQEIFDGKIIPLPSDWGGFLVTPYEYEFFLYGENRLNDRFIYELIDQKWKVQRLQP